VEDNKSRDVWLVFDMCKHPSFDAECMHKCPDCGAKDFSIPDFADRDRILLLEEMKKREDWPEFCDLYGVWNIRYWNDEQQHDSIYVDLIIQRGKLLDAVHSWFKEKGLI
jgi:hypothetical protein